MLNVPQFNGKDVVERFSVSVFEVNCHASRMKITARMRFAVDSATTPVVRFNLTMASCWRSTLPVICMNKSLNVWIQLKEEECKTIPIIITSYSNLAQQKLDRHLRNMLTNRCGVSSPSTVERYTILERRLLTMAFLFPTNARASYCGELIAT